jgi:hypothetical protein
MIIKALLITSSNEDPRVNDDWHDAVIIHDDSMTNEDMMIKMCDEEHGSSGFAIWLYEGEDWEDKEEIDARFANGGVRYTEKFHPWDTDNISLIRVASEVDEEEDTFMEDWRREIAMEAGMMGGCAAYNDVMGY